MSNTPMPPKPPKLSAGAASRLKIMDGYSVILPIWVKVGDIEYNDETGDWQPAHGIGHKPRSDLYYARRIAKRKEPKLRDIAGELFQKTNRKQSRGITVYPAPIAGKARAVTKAEIDEWKRDIQRTIRRTRPPVMYDAGAAWVDAQSRTWKLVEAWLVREKEYEDAGEEPRRYEVMVCRKELAAALKLKG